MGFDAFEIFVALAAGVVLFVQALKAFSHEVQETGGEKLAQFLQRVTERPGAAFVSGVLATAIVQSSSAISGLTVALVEAGTISFRSSLPVFLGANIGSTSTAWIVSANITSAGSVLIVASAVLGLFRGKLRVASRGVFLLGVILLALELISGAVAPLKGSTQAAEWLSYAQTPWIGLLIGAVGAAVLQSSSVTVGLAVIAVQQGLLDVGAVIPIVVGANVGTTSTALIAARSMGQVAQQAARANLIFNILGVLAFLPFMRLVERLVVDNVTSGDTAVAVVHLVFNIFVVVIGFAVLKPLSEKLEAKM